jgi:hypothetical protein
MEAHIKLSNGTVFKIYHNLPEMLSAAAQNWIARTNIYTDKSLCDYINSKGIYGKRAFTEKQWKKYNS